MHSVTPYVLYEDVASAVQWLSRAFGFREMVRYEDEDGEIYAELAFGSDRLMVARFAEGYRSPKRMQYINALVYLTVDDVDDHYAQAKTAGATIVSEPEDKPYGLRTYVADDLEGQRWMIAQQVRDVLPEEWGGQTVGAGEPDPR
jgi:PhnB protein